MCCTITCEVNGFLISLSGSFLFIFLFKALLIDRYFEGLYYVFSIVIVLWRKENNLFRQF